MVPLHVFDLRNVLLEKHAQHVVFIHFPSPARAVPPYWLSIEVLTALLVVATAHLGGFLSGVNS